MVAQYTDKIKRFFIPEYYIIEKIILLNINKVFYLSLISIMMRILTISVFLSKTSIVGDKEVAWRTGIIISHVVYLVLLTLLCCVSFRLRKNTTINKSMLIVQYTMILILLLVGTVITSIDQLVTSSVTPFVIACIAVAVIFIVRPLYSLIIFSSTYIFYYLMMGIFQEDLVILLSNRINGLAIVVLGIFLSFILWNHNVTNLRQKEHIECQRKILEDKNKELRRLATTDFLTGLINRRCFEEKINIEMSRIRRYGHKTCLLIMDIDDFKNINDRYGHPVGDGLLKSFANLIEMQLRESDIVSRIGGEEFAVLLLFADEKSGEIVAQKIRNSIESHVFIINNFEISITVSIGVTLLDNRVNSYEEAYLYADRALYSAKAKGKNRVEVELK